MTISFSRLQLALGVASLAVLVTVIKVIAAPPGSVYAPGETLAPTCAPGDTNCTVTAPMAAVTPGDSGNVLTSNGSAWTSAAPAGGGFSYASCTATVANVNATISPACSLIKLNNTSGGAVQLASTPTVSDGTDGQQILIINTGPNAVEIMDEGILLGSGVRLPAAPSVSLAIGDSLPLVYVQSEDAWYASAARANY